MLQLQRNENKKEEAAAESARARRQKALADAAAFAATMDFGELSGAEDDTREPEKEDPTTGEQQSSTKRKTPESNASVMDASV